MSTKVVWDDDGVTWLPHPGAPRTVTFSFPGRPDRASAFASGVRAIVTDQMTWSDSTPFWMVGIAWMHHDGSRLAPGSIGKYRGDIFKVLIPAIGGVKLADLGRDAYQRLFDHLDADDASESKRREAARTVGTIGSWLQTSGRWPYPADPFGPGAAQRAIRHSAFAKGHDADIRSGRKALKIGADMCPRFDDTVAFAETLTEVVVDRWGPHAAYLGQALVVQYLTGYRLGELLAARPEEFHLNGGRHVVAIHHQIDASRRPTATGPVLKAPKNHTSRELVVWSWSVPVLQPIIADAEGTGRGYLFASPEPLLSWKRRFQDVYSVAAKEAGYGWSSHWHRHAFASYNLATPTEGGYGRSLKKVALWLGHAQEPGASDLSGVWGAEGPPGAVRGLQESVVPTPFDPLEPPWRPTLRACASALSDCLM